MHSVHEILHECSKEVRTSFVSYMVAAVVSHCFKGKVLVMIESWVRFRA